MAISKILDQALSPVPQGVLFGLTMSTAGSSTTLSVAAGLAADSTGVRLMKLASSLAKTTSAWTAGTAAGALDTGTIAINTWYHWFVIENPATGVVDVLCSLSATAPTLPSGYTLFRRIGAMKTNGSSQWTSFTQLGDEFLWLSPPSDLSAAAIGNGVATTLTFSVPTGVQVNALVEGFVSGATGGSQCYFSSFDQTDIATPNGTTAIVPATGGYGGFHLNLRTNTSAQIRARANNASLVANAATVGWIDTRGKNS